MPHLIIIAGPNGAGKSTTAPALLKEALCIDNSDQNPSLIAAKINNNPVAIEQPYYMAKPNGVI